MTQEENKTKCLRCGKVFSKFLNFYELKDTALDGKTFRICKECGVKLVKWLKNKIN